MFWVFSEIHFVKFRSIPDVAMKKFSRKVADTNLLPIDDD